MDIVSLGNDVYSIVLSRILETLIRKPLEDLHYVLDMEKSKECRQDSNGTACTQLDLKNCSLTVDTKGGTAEVLTGGRPSANISYNQQTELGLG